MGKLPRFSQYYTDFGQLVQFYDACFANVSARLVQYSTLRMAIYEVIAAQV